MSISYGRSLPKGPRPKPPQPKLGEIGPSRDLICVQRKRRKKKQPPTAKSSTGKASQPTSAEAQKQAATTKKKAKPERPKQNTPIRVEVVRPAQPSFPDRLDDTERSTTVVVEWRKDGHRYLAWGKLGVKKVNGWRECTSDSAYQRLLQKLRPIGSKLSVKDSQIPFVEILNLIIATGKVLRPRQRDYIVPPARPKPLSSQQMQRRSRRGSHSNQSPRQRRSAAAEAARHEALVIRPSDAKPSAATQRRQSSRQPANATQKRKQMLTRQRKELSRSSWLRRHGYEARQAPRDMMDVALQGGSPGLKR